MVLAFNLVRFACILILDVLFRSHFKSIMIKSMIKQQIIILIPMSIKVNNKNLLVRVSGLISGLLRLAK